MRIGECADLACDCLRATRPDQWAVHVPLGKLKTERLEPVDPFVRTGRRLRTAADGRVRQPGGGRKKVEQADPELPRRLKAIVEETTAGDPMSPLRWTSKATRTIAAELTRSGHPISSVTMGRCLEVMGYTLQANVKTREGPPHPNRDAQFRYLNRQVKAFRRAGDPVISVDTKKKELVGAFKNGGAEMVTPRKGRSGIGARLPAPG